MRFWVGTSAHRWVWAPPARWALGGWEAGMEVPETRGSFGGRFKFLLKQGPDGREGSNKSKI